jgi:predicted protein tyrosine phosphatase
MPIFRMAGRTDIEQALQFARAVDPEREHLLVHCHVGIGRTTAVALAIITDRLGRSREGAALAELLRIGPQAVPNLPVLALADEILGRVGALEAHLARHIAPEWALSSPGSSGLVGRVRGVNRVAGVWSAYPGA